LIGIWLSAVSQAEKCALPGKRPHDLAHSGISTVPNIYEVNMQ